MRAPFILPAVSAVLLIASCNSAPQADAPETNTPPASEQPQAASETAPPASEQAASETAPAVSETAQPFAIYAEDEVAIRGADPVAYFTESAYVAGSDQFTHEWGDATWYFASADNRDLFASDPEKYAPQYGGFCAWAVSQGSTAPIDPTAWRIVDGKLYLNFNENVQNRWSQDIPGNIAKADANWPGVLEN